MGLDCPCMCTVECVWLRHVSRSLLPGGTVAPSTECEKYHNCEELMITHNTLINCILFVSLQI